MKNKLSGFLINLLGVILGITLTFGVNSLWQKREENRKIKEMLTMVRKELEINKEYFKGHENTIKEDSYVYVKILENKDNIADFPKDTLLNYLSRMFNISDYQLTTSSWEIFQNSELIQKMTNKELLIRLTECYWLINRIQEFVMKEYWDIKRKILVYDLDPYQFFKEILKNKEAVYFFTVISGYGGYSNFMDIFLNVDIYIDYTIMILDKYGDFQYDMDDKDKEFELFFETRMDSLRSKNDTLTTK